MMKSSDRKWLILTSIKGIGPVKGRQLIETIGLDDAICSANEHEIEMADKIFENCYHKGYDIITLTDSRYPARLRDIKNAPIVLYASGDTRLLNAGSIIGIVGARRCSHFGKNKAISLAAETVGAGGVVISGMAKGVDGYSHTSAIFTGGKSIAVLGNGLDICYPKEHAAMMEEIRSKGLLISEYPPGTCPNRYSFVQRNRIIAGMSDILNVVDVGRNSGTRTTIAYAKSYNRKVVMYNDNQ